MTTAEVDETLGLRWMIGVMVFVVLVFGALIVADNALKDRPAACPCGCRPK
jgi:hypothetical protein